MQKYQDAGSGTPSWGDREGLSESHFSNGLRVWCPLLLSHISSGQVTLYILQDPLPFPVTANNFLQY